MFKWTPTIYMFGVFSVVVFVWFANSDDRLLNVTWSLPGLFAGTFTVLWNIITKLERKIVRLEKEIQRLNDLTKMG